MSRIQFTKMHGLGNDFMVIDNTSRRLDLNEDQIRRLSDRHFGVGFDQLLIVEAPSTDDAEFDYRIYNADGLEVEHCGNGARCFARFVRDQGLTDSRLIPVNTLGGPIKLEVLDDGRVKVLMGVPSFEPLTIPVRVDESVKTSLQSRPVQALSQEQFAGFPYRIQLDLQQLCLSGAQLETLKDFDEVKAELAVAVASIGNPHVLIRVSDLSNAPVERLGAWLENHEAFPQRVNVGFVQTDSRTGANLRVFERGVGETNACGTGACAASAIGILSGLFEHRVKMTLLGGELDIYWPDLASDIEMTGACTTVFEGHIEM